MCGLAGFAARSVSSSALDSALRLMHHRGPDDYGFLCARGDEIYAGRDLDRFVPDARLLLVHRRLSILDLSDDGWQPMRSESGRYHVVFNGEIYNYVELRDELEALGSRFRSGSDTEVLVEGFARWGAEILPRLTGMFAFAVWDQQENRLLLARDSFGIKPLYYTCGGDEFAFASEIPVLLENSSASREVNPERLFAYLRFGMTDHGGQTMFRDVRQLPSAHYMVVDLETLTATDPIRYWALQPQQRSVSANEARDAVRELFLDNVRLHLRSDAPLGATLSGGIDSSSIVMAMRHVMPRDFDLQLFSFVPDDERVSEERWIDIVAERAGGRVHKIAGNPSELAEDLQRLTRIHGEPLGSTSCVAQYHVFRRAREQGIKVMLDGQGADEIFAGYRHHLGARLASLVKHGSLLNAAKFWHHSARLPGLNRTRVLALAASYLLPTGLQKWGRQWMGKDVVPSWMNGRWFEEQGVSLKSERNTPNKDVLHWDLQRSLSSAGLTHLLRYEDRNSMAHSVESRVPFLTPQLASYALSLPEDLLVSPRGESKSIFRAAMRGIVPDEILDRRDKLGFVTPERQWLNTLRPWVERTLDSPTARAIPAFQAAQLLQHCRDMLDEKRPFSFVAWRWLNLIEWSQQFQVVYPDALGQAVSRARGAELAGHARAA